MAEHEVPADAVHNRWNRSLTPALVVRSGDIIHGTCSEGSGGQIFPGAPASVLESLDPGRFYPLAGPVYVAGAEAGDLLEVEILEMVPLEAWGWCAIIPGLGLLSEDYRAPHLKVLTISGGEIAFKHGVRLKARPFCGTIGVAPALEGDVEVGPPGRWGGNIDTPGLVAGSRLYLAVQVAGALLSIGDGHAAQGHGEVCVNALECSMSFSVRVVVHKGTQLPQRATYAYRTPPSGAHDEEEYYSVGVVGPDLYENTRNVVRAMIDWLVNSRSMTSEDAYMLCSLSLDILIPQVVNQPNLGVTGRLPLSIFT